MSCPGIEIAPGHWSGCDAAETGARDCPRCGPLVACPVCGASELAEVVEQEGRCYGCCRSERPTDRPAGPPTDRVPPLTPDDLEWPEERITEVQCPRPPGRLP